MTIGIVGILCLTFLAITGVLVAIILDPTTRRKDDDDDLPPGAV
jgi:hypothetical protein